MRLAMVSRLARLFLDWGPATGHFRMESETECGELDSGASRSQLSGAGARSLSHSVVHCTGQAKVRGCSLVQEDELFLGL